MTPLAYARFGLFNTEEGILRTDKIVLVTCATSGIGRATALAIARQGCPGRKS